ncbi:MAG: signal peptidase I [Thermoprotei archaeon]|nr:signal peptidase I [Thermoprotei archaeon]
MREGGKVRILSLSIKVILVLICLITITPSIIRLFPFLILADSSYIVLSGSMQPTLRPGDIVFLVKVDPSEIEVGDIVAIKTDRAIYVHRVIEKIPSEKGVLLKLKGDANEDPDRGYVKGSEVIGKMYFSFPTGYLCMRGVYTFLAITFTILLVLHQVIKICRIYDTRRRGRRGLKAILLGKGGRRMRKPSVFDTTSALLLLIIVASTSHVMASFFVSGITSYFVDVEATRVTTEAATWKVESSITCSISPNPLINLGDNITVSGRIKPARDNVVVTLKYEIDERVITRTVITDENGVYGDVFTPDCAGTWTVQASWKGDRWYYGATSRKVTFEVLEGVNG